eukprot:3045965-Rhodomonas_salina.1
MQQNHRASAACSTGCEGYSTVWRGNHGEMKGNTLSAEYKGSDTHTVESHARDWFLGANCTAKVVSYLLDFRVFHHTIHWLRTGYCTPRGVPYADTVLSTAPPVVSYAGSVPGLARVVVAYASWVPGST